MCTPVFSHLLLPSDKLTMPSIGLSFFILGLVVVASVTAQKTAVEGLTTSSNARNPTVTTMANNTTTTIMTNTTTMTANPTMTTNTTMLPTSPMNYTMGNTTMLPYTTPQGDKTTSMSTRKPMTTSRTTTAKPSSAGPSDSTGIIVLVVIIVVAVVFGAACFLARKRGRRYSVDFNSRPDGANIPLSTVEPMLPIDAVPQNGLQTFERVETPSKEPEETDVKPEVQEEQKAAAPLVDSSAESAAPAAPAPSPDSSQDKPKEDVVEPSPPPPSVEEKTDDEGGVSNKTSVETLKEGNENNSNNADISQERDLMKMDDFWDVPLNCPV